MDNITLSVESLTKSFICFSLIVFISTRIYFAVFTENVKYILVDINTINEKQINDFVKDSTESVILSTYYHQNDIQYWCIKNNNNFTRI